MEKSILEESLKKIVDAARDPACDCKTFEVITQGCLAACYQQGRTDEIDAVEGEIMRQGEY